MQYIPGYMQQKAVDFQTFKRQLDQINNNTLQIKKEPANKYGNWLRTKHENGLDEHTDFLADLTLNETEKSFMEVLKAMSYGRLVTMQSLICFGDCS